MGIFSRLFGSTKTTEQPGKTLEHKGFLITATPFMATSGWQLAGEITKDGKNYKFIRADQFSDKAEAESFALQKGTLIIDQMSDNMFSA